MLRLYLYDFIEFLLSDVKIRGKYEMWNNENENLPKVSLYDNVFAFSISDKSNWNFYFIDHFIQTEMREDICEVTKSNNEVADLEWWKMSYEKYI